MAESLNQISLSLSHYESEDQGCMFCEQDQLCFPQMIRTALYEKHSNSQQDLYLHDINDILQERLCESTVRYLQMIFLSQDEQTLKREYRANEYNRKITALGEYYKFHRDIPRFHTMPIQRILARHYDKRRQHQYKQVKKFLKDEDNMPIEDSMESQSRYSSYVKKSRYSTLLDDIKKSFLREEQQKNMRITDQLVEKSESIALFEVYDKLSEIVKGAPDIQQMTGSYLHNSGVRSFQKWVRKSSSKKNRKDPPIQQHQISIEPDFTKKKIDFHIGSNKKLISNNNRNSYNTLNVDYKKVLEVKRNTVGPAQGNITKTIRPLLKLSQYIGSVPLKMADKERSIEKIYGMHTDAKPTKIYQRILTAEKRPQDSTNGSSNRLDIGGRSKSIDRLTVEKLIERAQQASRPESRSRPESTKRTSRSVSKPQLQRYQPKHQIENRGNVRSTSNLKGKKSLSMPSIRQDARISRQRVVQSSKNSIDSDKRYTKRNLHQLQMIDIMIQKKTKVDPGTIYKNIKSIL